MCHIKRFVKNQKYILFFLGTLFVFGIATGLILSLTNIEVLKESVLSYVMNIQTINYNYLLIHFFLLVLCFVTSFLGIGIPFLCALWFYEGLTWGFVFGIFSATYQLGGFLFAFLFIVITKGIYLLLFIFFFLKCLNIARKMIGKYLYKTDPSVALVRLIKGCACIICLAFLNDFLLLLLGGKVVPFFRFFLN